MSKTIIVQVINHMHHGGAQKIVFNLCKGISSDFDILLICKEGEFSNILKKDFSNVTILDRSSKNLFLLRREIKELTKNYKVRLLHTHNRLDIAFRYLLGRTYVHLHTYHSAYPTKNFLMYLIRPQYAVSISKTVKKYLDKYRIDNRLIYNGVRTNLKHKEFKLISSDFTFVGRLSEEKGIIDLIQAFRQKSIQNSLAVIGDGSLRSSCETQAKGIQVEFFGSLSSPWETIGSESIVVIPSHFEGFCLVAVEAVINGNPIICSKIPVLQEILSFLPDECFFLPKNYDSITSASQWCLKNKQTVVDIIKKKSLQFANNFSEESMQKRYLTLYKEIAN